MHHTLLFDTNFTSLLQAPSFYHTLRALGPKTPAFSQCFIRAEEDDLGVSFNTQSQTPDIPGISSHEAFSYYTSSLQAQSKAPDIQFFSLCVSTEDLLLSGLPLRVSTKPCQVSVDCPFSSPQIPDHIPPTSYQVLSRKGFDDNWEEFSSVIDVVNWTPSTGYLPRLPTKHTVLHLTFQFVSQGNVQELPIHNQDSPYPDFWWFEFHVVCLRFRLDSQSLVDVHSVDLGFSWFFLTKWHMMSIHVWSSSAFVFIIVWVWHLYPLTFVSFYSVENKR